MIDDPLLPYKEKRDFSITPEPKEDNSNKTTRLSYVIQRHDARNTHYDLRLELDGVLKSWAIPKGPSYDPTQKRLAVKVEDHPVSYGEFEGVIPPKQYGAGKVIIWDKGTWEPMGDPVQGLNTGDLKFRLHGVKLQGTWVLVRMNKKSGEKQEPWLLIKERDTYIRKEAEYNVLEALPDSVLSGRGRLFIPFGAKEAPVPSSLSPQLATLVEGAPREGDWSYEIKFDGYRILARIDGDQVNLFTRNGLDWTDKLESLELDLKGLKIAPGWLDGELVALGADGMPDFGALQKAFESGNTKGLRYYVFDLPYHAGFDLRSVRLAERRALLQEVLRDRPSGSVLFSEDFEARGSDIVKSACQIGLEGVIGKRKDSYYVSGRSLNWIKLKCSQSQEFVVVGYTENKGQRGGIGALLLGVNDDDGCLIYTGRVGTGFDNDTAKKLYEKLAQKAVGESPLFEKPKDAMGNWVSPDLVAEVSFAGWTKSGRIRHGVFRGLRKDKPAALIHREAAQDMAPVLIKAPEKSGYQISNPDRVIDASTGIKKQDIINYYQLASKWMLPQLAGRPVSFLRAPSGLGGQMFFQKHGESLRITGLKLLDPSFDPGHPSLMEIDSFEALMGAVQMNVIEFHTWNATTQNLEMPDRMVFDLDPGEGITWAMMLEAAGLTHTLLEELGLESFLKTSGGKGLHIVVPLLPVDDWDTVKDFSRAVAQHLAKVIPSRFTDISGPRNRVGKIFVDYIRNGRGATTVASLSVRARPGMGVSMPCSWEELSTLTGGAHWTVSNAWERLDSGENPWGKYADTKQMIGDEAKKILLHP
ncbi:MAG: DNA ligase D [Eubacteriaceae bacterium]|nr:DNA ligase D [Eubacteriaceae bacterium]